jgi:hypothetical protein
MRGHALPPVAGSKAAPAWRPRSTPAAARHCVAWKSDHVAVCRQKSGRLRLSRSSWLHRRWRRSGAGRTGGQQGSRSHWPLPLNRGGGVYIHAERLLAKAGGSNCKGRGISHPWNEAQREWKWRSKVEGCTSEARKPGETPCGREGRTPLRSFCSCFQSGLTT